MSNPIFIDDPGDLLRVVIAAPVMYGLVILSIRLSGKRSTSQMNNFDWVVTVAMGSLMASGIMLEDVTIAETALAIAALLALQWMLTKLLYHWNWVGRLVKAEPRLLFSDGEFLGEALRRERVTKDEVISEIRASGLSSIEDVRWVILESDASMSVIPRTEKARSKSAMAGVRGYASPSVSRGE